MMKKPQNSQEEEVALSSASGPVPPPGAEDVKFQDTQEPEGILSDLAKTGASDEDIVDSIIQIPEAQLIPWEECTIPSKGMYYNWTSGVIQVKAWGANVDKILATSRLAQTGQSIDYMLASCCKFPDGFEPTQLLVGDQIFLLYYLRGITHGNIYEFITTCPNPDCQATGAFTADLNELAETIVWADESLGAEPFKVSLPYLSKKVGKDIWVALRYMRVADSQYIIRQRRATNRAVGRGGHARVRKRQQKRLGAPQQEVQTGQIDIDDSLMKNLETIVVSALGVEDRFKIRAFVDKLHSSDLAVIREWLRDHSPGIDTQVELNCGECGNEFRVMLPITEAFFRPQVP